MWRRTYGRLRDEAQAKELGALSAFLAKSESMLEKR